METKKKLWITLFSLIVLLIIGIANYHFINHLQPKALPTDPLEAKNMRKDFKGKTLKELNKGFFLVNDGVFKFKLNSLASLLNLNSKLLRVYFIQLSADKFDFNKHAGLNEYKDKLYLAFAFQDSNNKVSGDYFILDEEGGKIIITDIFQDLKANYDKNIKSKINSYAQNGNNTDYVKVDMVELNTYIEKIKNSSFLNVIKPHKFIFELTQETQNESNKSKGIVGQLTFFNNVESNIYFQIGDLSSFNVNSLCPPC